MESRKEEEKHFHDHLRMDSFGQRWSPELEESVQHDPAWVNMKYYSIERASRQLVLDWFVSECKGKRVLDYCCGNGEDGIFIAQNGAGEVCGIDISGVSVENCTKRAKELGVTNISYREMDAESLQFGDDHFDIVTEYGALHHLNLEKAFSEMARVLKSDGRAICVEALGHNQIIKFYRKVTPKLRTEWEVDHILKKKQIEIANRYFEKVDVLGFFHLATLAAVPFRKFQGFNRILAILEAIDNVMLKTPVLKWQAWQVVFVMSNPK